MNNKAKIRESFLKTRLFLSKDYQTNSSKIIERKINHYIQRYNLKAFAIFISKIDEPFTHHIIVDALKEGIEVYLPRINGEKIEFRKIKNIQSDIVKNELFNIFEPKIECELLENIKEISTIFVPLVAFDKHLNRVGSGKGYYDRWFNENQYKGFKVGICQSSQLSNQIIDVEPHDVALNSIITEKQIYVPLESNDDEDSNFDITYAVFNDETIIN
ncbi:5-formyltetrahydrofolate cyclo-ligase [Mesoplasma corruscae]|uniref:5-formyltetrahydrofolate cyclo-ligase n=1 Tax=Mesoplasma corruscae TaxID=216874 RepID=A0A2S5RGF4_9MOLU|nr:5-formyltetrahydrofolate cyclo-ligase [Mesoplasma corruscae]PPE06419.1 5-formyltetrahydrofolate cyclo-ligase [Mesoplasma corruscae]